MKRLVFSTGFPPSLGGHQNYVYARCVAAPQDIEVLTAECDGSQAFDSAQSFPVTRFSYPSGGARLGPLGRVAQLATAQRALQRKIRRGSYGVVELSTVFPGVVAAMGIKDQFHFRMVSYALGDDVLRPLRTWYAAPWFRRSLTAVDLFVAISRYTKHSLVRAGVPEGKVVVIPPPLDRERFGTPGNGPGFKAELPPHDLMLLTISRLVKKKGIDKVIEILPGLRKKHPGLIYVVGGEGEDLARLKGLAAERNVADCVHFIGRVPVHRMADIYAAADVFIMPTRADARTGSVEGFGIVFLEAGSQGVPVIGPAEGGSADAIIDGVTGFLVDASDNEDIAAKADALLSNPEIRRRFGQAGKERAFQNPDWSPLTDIEHRLRQ